MVTSSETQGQISRDEGKSKRADVVRAFVSFTRENTLPRILSFLSSTRMFVTAYIKWRKMLNVEQVEKN